MTAHPERGRTLAALGLSLVVLTGCGSDRVKVDNAYVAAAGGVVRSFDRDFQGLQADFTPASSPTQDLRTLSTMQGAVDRAVARLGRVDPPASIAALHRTLVAQLRAYDAAIATAQQGFTSTDLTQVLAARGQLSRRLAAVGTQIMATINTINAKLR